ncbi:hypothetical protein RSOL_412320 [Rhizoctonia solani AG-3 Rhs1AP]|uniref:Uncharacterized protein n=1 Tax=Rhizoctonia solani AG-3 Rhs1AP TaxID=1086054 RepID=X8JFG6_9AGAM|nr:hypothetical protein RSOL_412320 [Rhizoctonia solani AG-3 Rhs1AP]
MANTQVPVKFKLPPAPPGFPNSPKQPESTDQITSQYLSDLRVYLQRLKYFHESGCGVVGVQMLTEVELHKAWVTRYLLNQAQPHEQVITPPANLTPINSTVPTIDSLRTILADGFREVNKKLDDLATDVKKLQANNVTINKKLDDLGADAEELRAHSVMTSDKLDRLTADGVVTTKKLDESPDVQKLQDEGVHDNGVSLTGLDRKVTDLPQTEGFKQAISASIRENETILDIRDTSEELTRLQRGLARVDRVQCQLFNATRANNESWLEISNEDGVLPSEQDLVVVQSRDHLSRLNSRGIAELLGFYGCIPSDFHPADTPAVRKTNFVRQSQNWSPEVQLVHLGTLSNIFTLPITSFSSSLPPPN